MSRKLNLNREATEFDSSFDDDSDPEVIESKAKKAKRHDLAEKPKSKTEAKASFSQFREEVTQDEGRRQRFHFLSLNAYDRHKKLVNDYFLTLPGSTSSLKRDTSRDKTDLDVIRENHRFLWDDTESDSDELTWGQRIAKKYCEKLFKEYCICDLSRFKENKIAMRWRTEAEVRNGKGQFMCGSKKCLEHELLRTWEVNFAYVEQGQKKNSLVKVRLCPDCSYKLNYFHKKKEVTKKKSKKDKKKKKRSKEADSSSSSEDENEEVKKIKKAEEDKKLDKKASEIWSAPVQVEQEKSRDEDFSEFLEDLFM